ncbi:MAG: hypothetical protein GX593_14370 [Actinomycetales bacterium]|nr:hypothetical protein [Actinomycetales bacterium]
MNLRRGSGVETRRPACDSTLAGLGLGGLTIVAVMALGACSPSTDPVRLSIAEPDAAQWDGSIDGDVEIDPSGCVVLRVGGEDYARMLLVWPSGTERVEGSPGGVTSVAHGELSFAAPVTLRGGSRLEIDEHFFGADDPPENCSYDEVFLVAGW